MDLIKEMRKHLPIVFYPTKGLCRSLNEQGKEIDKNTKLIVNEIEDSDDAGGIVCIIGSDDNTEVFGVSLTHLIIDPRHPLRQKVNEYIKNRLKKLKRESD